MISLQTYFPTELQRMIRSSATKFSDVLSLAYISKSTQIGFNELIEYFSKHSKEVLHYAFCDEKSIASTNAYAILCQSNERIVRPILEDSSFQNMALETLSNPNVSQFIIGRLSSLTLCFLTKIPEVARESCEFINHLLKYCDDPGTFNFFESICSDDETFAQTHIWLNDVRFAESLMREINNIDFSYVSSEKNILKDKIYIKTVSFYKLMAKCCLNQVLCIGFQNEHSVQVLTKCFPNEPTFVCNARWSAISASTSKTTAPFLLKELFTNALNLLNEQFDNLKEFRVSALEFITKILAYAPLSFDVLLQSSMPQMLIHIVLQFPYSTFLHSAFLKFVENGLKREDFALKIVGCYSPVIVDITEEKRNRVLIPIFMKMLDMFLEAAKTNKNINTMVKETPGLRNFIRDKLKKYKEVTSKPYGESPSGIAKIFRKLL